MIFSSFSFLHLRVNKLIVMMYSPKMINGEPNIANMKYISFLLFVYRIHGDVNQIAKCVCNGRLGHSMIRWQAAKKIQVSLLDTCPHINRVK